MKTKLYDYGMIGLGTMGCNLVYNICDHGYSVVGYDKDFSKLELFEKEKGKYKLLGAKNINELLDALKKPRIIMLLVPAGPIVDSVISELKPLISEGDLIMDCGNSHFTDTERRMKEMKIDKIYFMGVGISGGESGARYGPSIMPGGAVEAYKMVDAMLQSISAKVKNQKCVAYMGRGAAGHYVKMVHNGIEYALMQSIAESYQLLKEVGGLNNDELYDVFSKYNNGLLQSYLIEITAAIFKQKDDLTSESLIDRILDSAHQKGTGKWMSQSAMDLQVAVPAIDAAVSARDLSAIKNERVAASKKFKEQKIGLYDDKDKLIKLLEQSLYFSMITTYAQGFLLLHHASGAYHYDLKSYDVAKIWRGGCIIRSALLENIKSAFKQQPDLLNLMMNDHLSEILIKSRKDISKVVNIAIENGIPVPCFVSSLTYFDGYRKRWLPSNLIQAQRDYFGAHTYQRIDKEGDFHTQWDQKS